MAEKEEIGTVAVAILIIVMAVFFVLYLISLPPSERQRLLNVTASGLPFAAVASKRFANKFANFTNFLKFRK